MGTFDSGIRSLATQLDDHLEAKREFQLMQEVESEAITAERDACKRDVCTYCGGRGPTHKTSVIGPNEAGNYVHEPTRGYASKGSGDGPRLCDATAIFIRERYEAAKKAQRASKA